MYVLGCEWKHSVMRGKLRLRAIVVVGFFWCVFFTAIGQGEGIGAAKSSATLAVVDGEFTERVRVLEGRLRSCALPAMRRSWVLQVVAADEDVLSVKILPSSSGPVVRATVPARSASRPGSVEKAVGLAANAVCWLVRDPHPLARPFLPHWLTLAWRGWVDVERHAAYEQVVWKARSIGIVPGLEEIFFWREEEFSALEEDYRTAFCFWLLRSLLLDPGRTGLFLAALERDASEALALLPRGWWNARVAEARAQLRGSPFLSVEDTRKKLLDLMERAPSPLPSAADIRSREKSADRGEAMRNGEAGFEDSTKPRLMSRFFKKRDGGSATHSGLASSVTVEELGPSGWKPLAKGNGDDGNEKPKGAGGEVIQSESALRRDVARRRAKASGSVFSASGDAVNASSAPITLIDLVRGGKNASSLSALRQARHVAEELVRLGSPVYRDASGRLALALAGLERRWDAVTFERELEMVREEVARIARLEGEVSDALDWAEMVFVGVENSTPVEDYLAWLRGLEEPLSPGEKIDEILLWRERAARFSGDVKGGPGREVEAR
jgi:hypothetical protein